MVEEGSKETNSILPYKSQQFDHPFCPPFDNPFLLHLLEWPVRFPLERFMNAHILWPSCKG